MKQFDVVVAGGGPVGWACALACARSLANGSAAPRVAVVDREKVVATSNNDAPLSLRVYAVSERSITQLRSWGATFDDARCATIDRIIVHTSGSDEPALTLSAKDARQSAIGAVMEHEALTASIASAALSQGVLRIAGQAVSADVVGNARIVSLADGQMLQTRLVIIAEGRDSALVPELGFEAMSRDYERRGVVAHFQIDAPHHGDARQWFLPDDTILALLPLPDAGGAPAVSMVWSVGVSRAAALLAMSPDALLHAVTAATHGAVVATSVLQKAAAFPLSLKRLPDPVAERAIVVGDAAHSVHPLAGQGVNLGLEDAQCLAELMSLARTQSMDPGHALLTGKYRRQRYAPTLGLALTTDALARLYNLGSWSTLKPVADTGLRVLGRLPAFRRMLSSAAA
jgi:2-polyprenylphenol 6-hydroxylase